MELKGLTVLCICLVLVTASSENKDNKTNGVEPRNAKVGDASEKTQAKRGLFGLGYGYGGESAGHLELGHHESSDIGLGSGYGIEQHGHVKHITITKEIPVPVPHPIPYHVVKKVGVPYPVKVAVPVDRPYPVHVPKPYPVHVDKPVPYPVEKPVPYPVKVPVKVPYPVKVPVHIPKPYPVTIHKPVPYPVKVPVVVEKHVPVLVKGHHHHEGFGDLEFLGRLDHHTYGLGELHH